MPPDPSIVPINEPRRFGADELFFSTTDPKGIILSGNEVFARVSGYPVERLIGTPHNIIRHSHMPRAVFRLLWDYLEAGKTFAGFVKNMAMDGRYYWVMALVLPIKGGYLSVRLKPSSVFFDLIPGLYASLLQVEAAAGTEGGAWRAGMAAAGDALGAALVANGFPSYDHFMHAALAAEMANHRARGRAADYTDGASAEGRLGAALAGCQAAGPLLDDLFVRTQKVVDVVGTLDAKSGSLLELAGSIRLISVNALVAARRIGDAGRGVSVVTHELARIVDESAATVTPMVVDLRRLADGLRELAFSTTAAKLQVEMAGFFLRELIAAEGANGGTALAAARTRTDVATLMASSRAGVERLLAALPRVQQPFAPVAARLSQLSDTFRKLNVVRVTGLVEAASLAEARQFDEVFDTVARHLRLAETEIAELTSGVAALREALPHLARIGARLHVAAEALVAP